MKAVGVALFFATVSALSQDIDFTNRFATFTNLQGRSYFAVQVIRADKEGIIYREGKAGGGRVFYTNVSPAVLEYLGIPTNRIATVWTNLAELKAKAEAEQLRRAKLREEIARDAVLDKNSIYIKGRVVQVLQEGLLVQLENYNNQIVFLVDYPYAAADDDRIAKTGYLIGSNRYISVLGASKTVRKYTCSSAVARTYLLGP